MFGCERTRAIHPNQPIRLTARLGGLGQILIFRAVLQLLKPFADGFRRQVGDPQALHRLAELQMPLNQRKDMLPLTPGIKGIHQQVAAFRQLADHLQLIQRTRIRHQLELLGNDRQVVNVPFFVL
ncbi:hypothetical protein D3C86_1857370 [compost metagenome]